MTEDGKALETAEDEEKALEKVVLTRVMRLNAAIYGITAGLVAGLGLFIVTNWLVLKGGGAVGPHLSLLGQFFVGYEVTFVGSLIGFVYAFVCGLLIGYFVARAYNWLVDFREGSSRRRA